MPIDPEAVWEFDPDEVPNVHDLVAEVKAGSGGDGTPHWERTSLAPSMRIFQQSFLQPLLRSCQKALNEKARAKGVVESGMHW